MTILYIIVSTVAVLTAVWIFLTLGRQKRPRYDAFFGSLCAHRGLHTCGRDALRPENSLAAFRAAVERGYGIELDVHLSSDGVAVVFHDDSLKRMTGVDKRVSECSIAELHEMKLLGGQEHIPRFAEVLELVGGRVPLVVELKCDPRDDPEPLCSCVSAMMDEYAEKYGGDYCVESFNPFAVKWYRKNRPDVFRGQLSERFYSGGKRDFAGFMMEYLWVNVLGRPDFTAYNHLHRKGVSFRIWRRIYRAPYAYWTVKSEEELDALLAEDKRGCYIFEGFLPSYEKIR